MLGMTTARPSRPAPPPRRSRERAIAAPRAVLIKLVWCARALGWTRKRTLRYLLARDACTLYGRHWYVTRGQLRRAFPGVWDEVAATANELAIEAGDDDE